MLDGFCFPRTHGPRDSFLLYSKQAQWLHKQACCGVQMAALREDLVASRARLNDVETAFAMNMRKLQVCTSFRCGRADPGLETRQ